MPNLRSQKRSQQALQEEKETKKEVKMTLHKADNISQWLMLGPGQSFIYAIFT